MVRKKLPKRNYRALNQTDDSMETSSEHFAQGWIQHGECKPGLCGLEAACRHFPNNTYICICPHDSSPPTKDLRCPNRLTVPLTPRPIHNIIPPSGVNITVNASLSQQNVQAFGVEDTWYNTVVMTTAASCILAVLLLTVCWWRHKGLMHCMFLPYAQRKQQQNAAPVSLSKGLLGSDRYTPNPQYTPCSGSDSVSPTIPIICREKITFLQEIGEGCFGKVYKGELRSNNITETVAIKVLKDAASRETEEDLMREVEIMSAFRHTNILSLIGVALREPGKSPWMVFEFMPYGDLTEVLRSNSRHFRNSASSLLPRLTKEGLMSIALQIASGMHYLASQRFVHRDLACRNCLVGENLTVKIADFGMSRDVYTCDYYKIGGSRMLPVRWMSPESVMYGRFTLESDVWSYGVVLWEIYSLGKQPYFGHSNEEVVRLILQGIMLIPPEDCPPLICDLMRNCWKTEPKDRTCFAEIHEALRKASTSHQVSTLPRPPAFPVTVHPPVEILDADNYLQPLTPPGGAREYLQPLPD